MSSAVCAARALFSVTVQINPHVQAAIAAIGEDDGVKAWLTAGLSTDDLELVVEFRSLGVPPEAMTWGFGS